MANCIRCGRALPAFTFGKKICKWCVQYDAALRGEVPEDAVQEVMPAPWARRAQGSPVVTLLFIAVSVVVFVVMAASGVSILNPTSELLVKWGANFGPYTLGGEWWRLLSCVFVHIGILHIALNMWCLWNLGRLGESLYGKGTFAVVYLVTGVAASATSIMWNPVRVSAGASGAIFGIAGALISSLYLGEFSLPRSVVNATLTSVVKFSAYNLIFGFVYGRIDNSAHIGGLVSGLIFGAMIARLVPRRDKIISRVVVCLLAVALLIGGVLWIAHSRNSLLRGYSQSLYRGLFIKAAICKRAEWLVVARG